MQVAIVRPTGFGGRGTHEFSGHPHEWRAAGLRGTNFSGGNATGGASGELLRGDMTRRIAGKSSLNWSNT